MGRLSRHGPATGATRVTIPTLGLFACTWHPGEQLGKQRSQQGDPVARAWMATASAHSSRFERDCRLHAGWPILGPAFRPRQNRKVDLEGVSPFQVKYSVILSYQAREHLPGDTVATILVAEVKSTGSIPGPTPTSSRAASAYKELRHPRGSLLTTSRDSGSFLAGINVKSELHDFKKRTRNRNLINLGVSHDFEFKIPRNVTCAFPPKGFF